jgi:hypothetical protein
MKKKTYIIVIEEDDLKKCEVISRFYKKNTIKIFYDHYKKEYPNVNLKVYEEVLK